MNAHRHTIRRRWDGWTARTSLRRVLGRENQNGSPLGEVRAVACHRKFSRGQMWGRGFHRNQSAQQSFPGFDSGFTQDSRNPLAPPAPRLPHWKLNQTWGPYLCQHIEQSPAPGQYSPSPRDVPCPLSCAYLPTTSDGAQSQSRPCVWGWLCKWDSASQRCIS